MSNAIDLAVFDLVGTTVQDRGEAPRAFAAALAEVGVTPTGSQIKDARGTSKRSAIETLLGPSKQAIAETVYRRFIELLSAEYRASAAAVDGVEDVFSFLRARNAAVALNTGLNREIVRILLERLGWPRDRFAVVVCADDVARGRPAPDMIFAAMRAAGVLEPQRVMNVGDTSVDLQAGAAAGAGLNVGVCSGAHGRDILLGAPHTHLIATVADIPSLFR